MTNSTLNHRLHSILRGYCRLADALTGVMDLTFIDQPAESTLESVNAIVELLLIRLAELNDNLEAAARSVPSDDAESLA